MCQRLFHTDSCIENRRTDVEAGSGQVAVAAVQQTNQNLYPRPYTLTWPPMTITLPSAKMTELAYERLKAIGNSGWTVANPPYAGIVIMLARFVAMMPPPWPTERVSASRHGINLCRGRERSGATTMSILDRNSPYTYAPGVRNMTRNYDMVEHCRMVTGEMSCTERQIACRHTPRSLAPRRGSGCCRPPRRT
jgi:hypothetical protein